MTGNINSTSRTDIQALEAEFNFLNSRYLESGETVPRDAWLRELAELSSLDPEVTQLKARVYAAVWHENYRDGLTWWLEAAFQMNEERVDLSDAMARSIVRDVFDQATGPLLVSQQDSVFSYEEMMAVRASGQGRTAPFGTA